VFEAAEGIWMEDVLNDLGGNHFARTTPSGEAIEDEETRLFGSLIEFDFPKVFVRICVFAVSMVDTYVARLWTPPSFAYSADIAKVRPVVL
jgi:hypothetical protein